MLDTVRTLLNRFFVRSNRSKSGSSGVLTVRQHNGDHGQEVTRISSLREKNSCLDQFLEYYHSEPNIRESMGRETMQLVDSTKKPSDIDEDFKLFVAFLYRFTEYFAPYAIIQTGTFIGSSSIAIGKALLKNKGGHLYTIDPEPPSYFNTDNPVETARAAVKEAGVSDFVSFIDGYSTVPLDGDRIKLVKKPEWRLAQLAETIRPDVVIVDGDHTKLGCFLDLTCGASLLSEHGLKLMVIHDYLGIPEVREAVDTWLKFHPQADCRIISSPCGIAMVHLP